MGFRVAFLLVALAFARLAAAGCAGVEPYRGGCSDIGGELWVCDHESASLRLPERVKAVACAAANCSASYWGSSSTARCAWSVEGADVLVVAGLEDSPDADAEGRFDAVADFVARYRRGSVAVHCRQGVSRSVILAAAYLVRERGLSAAAALFLLRRHRPQVEPNDGFVEQLGRYARRVRAPLFLKSEL
jgi:hypothetical protein